MVQPNRAEVVTVVIPIIDTFKKRNHQGAFEFRYRQGQYLPALPFPDNTLRSMGREDEHTCSDHDAIHLTAIWSFFVAHYNWVQHGELPTYVMPVDNFAMIGARHLHVHMYGVYMYRHCHFKVSSNTIFEIFIRTLPVPIHLVTLQSNSSDSGLHVLVDEPTRLRIARLRMQYAKRPSCILHPTSRYYQDSTRHSR